MPDSKLGELRVKTIQMAPPFCSEPRPPTAHREFSFAWASLERACQHNLEFERLHLAYLTEKPEAVFHETDAATGLVAHVMRFTKPVPGVMGNIAADVAINLRAALDQSAFACAVAAGVSNPRRTQFPFGETEADIHSMRKGKSRDIPAPVFDMMLAGRPYRDGDTCFWAINKLSNAHKHRVTILPSANAITTAEQLMQTIGLRIEGLRFPQWDFDKGEMLLAKLPPGKGPQIQWQAGLSFSEPVELRGGCCGKQLDYMCNRVRQMVMDIESVASKTGLIR